MASRPGDTPGTDTAILNSWRSIVREKEKETEPDRKKEDE